MKERKPTWTYVRQIDFNHKGCEGWGGNKPWSKNRCIQRNLFHE